MLRLALLLLLAVAAFASPTHVAVGTFQGVGQRYAKQFACWNDQTLSWAQVPTPGFAATDTLNDVAVVGTNQLLVVGSISTVNGQPAAGVAYFNGASWCAPSNIQLYQFAKGANISQAQTSRPWTNAITGSGTGMRIVQRPGFNTYYILGKFNQVGTDRTDVAGLVGVTLVSGVWQLATGTDRITYKQSPFSYEDWNSLGFFGQFVFPADTQPYGVVGTTAITKSMYVIASNGVEMIVALDANSNLWRFIVRTAPPTGAGPTVATDVQWVPLYCDSVGGSFVNQANTNYSIPAPGTGYATTYLAGPCNGSSLVGGSVNDFAIVLAGTKAVVVGNFDYTGISFFGTAAARRFKFIAEIQGITTQVAFSTTPPLTSTTAVGVTQSLLGLDMFSGFNPLAPPFPNYFPPLQYGTVNQTIVTQNLPAGNNWINSASSSSQFNGNDFGAFPASTSCSAPSSIFNISDATFYISGCYRDANYNYLVNQLAGWNQARLIKVDVSTPATPVTTVLGSSGFGPTTGGLLASTSSPSFSVRQIDGNLYAFGGFANYNHQPGDPTTAANYAQAFDRRFASNLRNVAVWNASANAGNGDWTPAFGGWIGGTTAPALITNSGNNVFLLDVNLADTYDVNSDGGAAYTAGSGVWTNLWSGRVEMPSSSDRISQNGVDGTINTVLFFNQNGGAQNIVVGGQFLYVGTTQAASIFTADANTGAVAQLGGGLWATDNQRTVLYGGDPNPAPLSGIAPQWPGTVLHVASSSSSSDSGTLYAVGQFDRNSNGSCLNNVAVLNRAGGIWNDVANGCNAPVNVALVGGDGNLYVSGAFDSCGNTGTVARCIAVYNPGSNAWSGLAAGIGAIANQLAWYNGALYVTNSAGASGRMNTPNIAQWNGQYWSSVLGSCQTNCGINEFSQGTQVTLPSGRVPASTGYAAHALSGAMYVNFGGNVYAWNGDWALQHDPAFTVTNNAKDTLVGDGTTNDVLAIVPAANAVASGVHTAGLMRIRRGTGNVFAGAGVRPANTVFAVSAASTVYAATLALVLALLALLAA